MHKIFSANPNKYFYGWSPLGFLYYGKLAQNEIAWHVATNQIPEEYEVEVAKYFLPEVKGFIDIGCNTGLYCCVAASMCPESGVIHAFDPQKECIDTLCEALSDNKDNLMVIIAGYEKELKKCFFAYNQGLDSRFTWRFKTDDYKEGELNFNLQEKNVDELYDQAVKLVIEQQKISTSFIQRYLQIEYNRAARIVEQMESEGIISEQSNAGKRSVLRKK